MIGLCNNLDGPLLGDAAAGAGDCVGDRIGEVLRCAGAGGDVPAGLVGPNFDYAQVLVSQEQKILALRPCAEGTKDAYMWCGVSKGKRKPKPITCKLFFAKIVSLMNWNPKYRYKLLGRLIHSNGEYLIAFDLNAPEVYQRTFAEGEKPKTSRTPVFPSEWQTQFGLPYNVHKQSMQINIFDGYAVYAIKDTTAVSEDSTALPAPVITGGDAV